MTELYDRMARHLFEKAKGDQHFFERKAMREGYRQQTDVESALMSTSFAIYLAFVRRTGSTWWRSR